MNQFPDHSAVNAFTGFLLRKVSAASFSAFAEICAKYGLHPMHFGMLTIIAAEEPISQQDLGRRAGVDPSTMVGRMDALEELGLIERGRSALDRRTYEIRLTAKGRKVLRSLGGEAADHGERFFAALSAKERIQLHDLLRKLAEGLEDPA